MYDEFNDNQRSERKLTFMEDFRNVSQFRIELNFCACVMQCNARPGNYHYEVWWCNVLPDASFEQAGIQTLTARINSSNSCLKEKLLVINIPKQQFEKQMQIVKIDVWTDPSQISVFSGIQNRNTIPDGAKTHWNNAHRLWRRALEPESWKQFVKHPKFQFSHKFTMNSLHNLTKKFFRKCCIAYAKWMASWKLANTIHFALAMQHCREFYSLWDCGVISSSICE